MTGLENNEPKSEGISSDLVSIVHEDVKFAKELPSEKSDQNNHNFNLRPKRPLRHVQALKQQAKRQG